MYLLYVSYQIVKCIVRISWMYCIVSLCQAQKIFKYFKFKIRVKRIVPQQHFNMGLAIPVGWRFLRSFTIILERTFSFSFHRFLLVWVILHSLPFKRMYCSSSMLSLTSCPESFYELWHQKIWQFCSKGHILYANDKICISRIIGMDN